LGTSYSSWNLKANEDFFFCPREAFNPEFKLLGSASVLALPEVNQDRGRIAPEKLGSAFKFCAVLPEASVDVFRNARIESARFRLNNVNPPHYSVV
jgi:hypothetical protein